MVLRFAYRLIFILFVATGVGLAHSYAGNGNLEIREATASASVLAEAPHRNVDFRNQNLIEGIARIVFSDHDLAGRMGGNRASFVSDRVVRIRVFRRSGTYSLEVFQDVIDELNGLLNGRVVFRLEEINEVDETGGEFFAVYDRLGYRKKSLDVLFVPSDEFRDSLDRARRGQPALPDNAVCVEIRRLSKTGERLNDSIIISGDLERRARRSCIIEEFLHYLGLLNDVDGVPHSQVDKTSAFTSITEFDLCILTFLYSAEFKIFHDQPVFASRSGEVVRKLRPGGRGTICLGVPLDRTETVETVDFGRSRGFSDALLQQALRRVVAAPAGRSSAPRGTAVTWWRAEIPIVLNLLEGEVGSFVVPRVEAAINDLNAILDGLRRLTLKVRVMRALKDPGVLKWATNDPRSDGEINVLVVPTARLEATLRQRKQDLGPEKRSKCRFQLAYREDGTIQKAGIILEADEEGYPSRHCPLVMMTRALGLIESFGEANSYSMYGGLGRAEELSEFDACLLVFLYDPAFQEFHRLDSFLKHEARVLARLRPGSQGSGCEAPGR